MDYGRAKNNGANPDEPASASDVGLITLRYAEELRAVGQALQEQGFISIDLEVEGDGYLVRAERDRSKKTDSSFAAIVKQFLLSFGASLQTKERATPRAVELRYGTEEIQKLIQEGIARRLDTRAVPDHFSLPNILRQTGAYVDSLDHATLVRVVVNGSCITIRYKDGSGQLKNFKQDIQFFYDYWVKMYLHRSNRPEPMLNERRPTYVTRP
jgi:hypothetical protein